MTNKKYYSWQDVETAVTAIAVQMYKDNWRPDYVVGITRGGLPIATMLSHLIGVPMHTLDVRLRDKANMGPESNLWMAEDAFGYMPVDIDEPGATCRWDINTRKKILIVDDINDTGATFEWIKEDWQTGCLPSEQYAWDAVWGNTVKFATMTENTSSNFGDVQYLWETIDKAEKDQWLVFPWESDRLNPGY